MHLYCTLLIFSSANVTITVYFNIHVMAVYLLLLNNHVFPFVQVVVAIDVPEIPGVGAVAEVAPPHTLTHSHSLQSYTNTVYLPHTLTTTLSYSILSLSCSPSHVITAFYQYLTFPCAILSLSLSCSLTCKHCLLSISRFSLC